MLNGIALLVLGGYGVGVLLHGNLDELLSELAKDRQFLEWAIAVGLIYATYKSDYLNPIGKALIGVTITVLAMRIIAKTNAAALLSEVAQGRKTLGEALRDIVPAEN